MTLRLLRLLCGAAALWLGAAPLFCAADTIKLLAPAGEEAGRVLDGTIRKMSPTEVVVKQAMVDETVPVNQIDVIHFTDEPTALRMARDKLRAGEYDKALKNLRSINLKEIERNEVRQEVLYTAAMAMLRRAISQQVHDREAAQARIAKFLADNPQTCHYFEICEALGDLFAAQGQPEEAARWYQRLARAPWDDYRMRAGVCLGWAYVVAKRPAEALKQFEAVISDPAQGDLADSQKLAAQTGKVRCLAESRNSAAAVKFAKDLIAKVEPEDGETLARAYTALGRALQNAARQSDDSDQKKTLNQQASFAFLRVETRYPAVADAHAEALAGLIEVWNDLRRRDRAHEARSKLLERHPGSPWAAPYLKHAPKLPETGAATDAEESEGASEE